MLEKLSEKELIKLITKTIFPVGTIITVESQSFTPVMFFGNWENLQNGTWKRNK